MGGIFISHSSKNSAEAERLRDWLEEQGWGRSQVFLDLQDLKSGDSWRDVLNAMGDKEAVIVCLSNEWQSLRDSLLAKRITPQSFPWPPPNELTRSVYRGLQALDVQDAAIFLGRDADIARGLDELRRLRDGAPQRLLVILGASGAGKSSFLRAGLIARLRRDEAHFLVLPIVRPERAAISGAQGLTASLSAALGRAIAIANVAELASAFAELRRPVMERLAHNAAAAREAYVAKPPTIILPVDQAEELFGADNAERAKFCEIVSEAIVRDGNALLVTTMSQGGATRGGKPPAHAGASRRIGACGDRRGLCVCDAGRLATRTRRLVELQALRSFRRGVEGGSVGDNVPGLPKQFSRLPNYGGDPGRVILDG